MCVCACPLSLVLPLIPAEPAPGAADPPALSAEWSAGKDPLEPELEKGNCEAELGVMGEPELDVCIVRGVVAAEGDSERACDIERVEEGDLSRAVRRRWRGCKRSERRAAAPWR